MQPPICDPDTKAQVEPRLAHQQSIANSLQARKPVNGGRLHTRARPRVASCPFLLSLPRRSNPTEVAKTKPHPSDHQNNTDTPTSKHTRPGTVPSCSRGGVSYFVLVFLLAGWTHPKHNNEQPFFCFFFSSTLCQLILGKALLLFRYSTYIRLH